jgi:hypothetical protein
MSLSPANAIARAAVDEVLDEATIRVRIALDVRECAELVSP